jgi:tetratricopeptide (TPR) repeat protein
MTNLLDWDEDDLEVDPEEEYQALLNGLRRTQGFGLFFVQCTPFSSDEIIKRICKDLAAKKSEVLKFEKPIADGNVFKHIKAFLGQHTSTEVLFIQGLEHSLYDYEETKKQLGWRSDKIYTYSWHGVPPILINLNQQRERFRDSFGICLVFLLPVFAIRYLVQRAPDFFDWRSGILQYVEDSKQLAQKSREIWLEGDYEKYLGWSQDERNRRIFEIQALVDAGHCSDADIVNLYIEQGNLFAASQDYEASIAAYDKALQFKPDKHEAWYNRGIALGNLGRYKDEVAAYDKALEVKPDDHEAWNNRGIALFDLGRYEDAIASYDKALEIKPDKHEAWNNRGNALFDLGCYEDAIASYDKTLEIKPDKDQAWYNRGIALSNLGRYEDAIASYDKALEIKPDKHEAWYNRGNALFNLGRYEDAIASYGKTLEIKPDKHEAWYNRGVALGILGRYEDEIASYDKALEIKSDYPEAWGNRGVVLGYLGRHKDAIASYDKALKIKPGDPDALYNKACCYGLQGDSKNAVHFLQQAISLNSKYREMAKTDSDFKPVREDEQFQALISESS